MTNSSPIPDIHLPGYTLTDRLGAGGYGEVWRADAPGGLTKAVKIVFGRHDQSHAANEMRALERIKAVRHPFLLSLERIEVIDDRLLVVMELAEGSLRDRFRQCRANEEQGIPRAELLKYLRDAADALDFLCERHELQHLDIKPENLLLVGGHVKLADFGLVKDIHATQASLVGGMTPTYAAPELFQGRPSRHSDQYSLAIIYQEMLTGTVPFKGTTAGELTLQHINELPRLDALAEGDRFVISQALAKDPDHRFPSCSAMVEALLHQSAVTVAAPGASFHGGSANDTARRTTAAPEREVSSPTQIFDDNESTWANASAPVLITLPEVEPMAAWEAPEVAPGPFTPTPAIVIGIGGAAVPVLRRLRQSVLQHFGCEELPPQIGMLLIDTDSKNISAALRETPSGIPLAPNDTLCTPLRRPQDYREKSEKLLRWLSRRWLYNVPRSLCTEGIRPLGRLALVDHARQVVQRIRQLVTQVTDSQAEPQTGDAPAGGFMPEGVRVYLVGSISGGTAGGMLHDVAYAVRATLHHLGIAQSQILGIVTHTPSRDREKGELSRVNSFAWLNEQAHWSDPSVAYPGDEGAGLPGAAPEVSPFDHLYVLDLGDRADEDSLDEFSKSITQYLYCDMLTPGQTWLDACRAHDSQSDPGSAAATLRTFAVQTRAEALDPESLALAVQLLECWSEPSRILADDQADPIFPVAATALPELPLTTASLAAIARSRIDAQLEGDPIGFLRRSLTEAGLAPQTLTYAAAVQQIETLIPGEGGATLAGTPVERLAHADARQFQTQIDNYLLNQQGQGECRPIELLEIAAILAAQCARLQVDLRQQTQTSAETARALLTATVPTPQEAARKAVQLWKARLDTLSLQVATRTAQLLSQHVRGIAEKLETLLLVMHVAARKGSDASLELSPASLGALRSVELGVNEIIRSRGGLTSTFGENPDPEQVVAIVARLVEQTLKAQTTFGGSSELLACSGDEDHLLPLLCYQGGHYRELVVAPPTTTFEPKRLTPTGENAAAVVPTSLVKETISIVEASGLSPLHVAARFVDGRRDYADLAQRVHTRDDVAWTSLLESPEPTEPTFEEVLPEMLATQCLPAAPAALDPASSLV